MRAALFLSALVLASALAGCAGRSTSSPPPTPSVDVTSPTPSAAHFEISEITIASSDDADRSSLFEDDPGARIRYVVSQPADSAKESAFITYILNGVIVDVEQLTLSAGEQKAYERSVDDLQAGRTLRVEVRAGAATQRAEALVREWPRADNGTLTMESIRIRAVHGLALTNGGAVVNLTLENPSQHAGPMDLRVTMVCASDSGDLQTTSQLPLEPPPPGEQTIVEASLEDCPSATTRYGLEFRATGPQGEAMRGRLLLVPRGWQASAPASA